LYRTRLAQDAVTTVYCKLTSCYYHEPPRPRAHGVDLDGDLNAGSLQQPRTSREGGGAAVVT